METQYIQIVRAHELEDIITGEYTYMYKDRKKGFGWQQKVTRYKSVRTNVYFPGNLDEDIVAILEEISRTTIDPDQPVISINITVNVPQVITVEEVPDEFDLIDDADNYYLLLDGKVIRRQLEGIPCLLAKSDFELYDRDAFRDYRIAVENYENPDTTYYKVKYNKFDWEMMMEMHE